MTVDVITSFGILRWKKIDDEKVKIKSLGETKVRASRTFKSDSRGKTIYNTSRQKKLKAAKFNAAIVMEMRSASLPNSLVRQG